VSGNSQIQLEIRRDQAARRGTLDRAELHIDVEHAGLLHLEVGRLEAVSDRPRGRRPRCTAGRQRTNERDQASGVSQRQSLRAITRKNPPSRLPEKNISSSASRRCHLLPGFSGTNSVSSVRSGRNGTVWGTLLTKVRLVFFSQPSTSS